MTRRDRDLDRQPTGRVSHAWWRRGYQEALRDITDALQRGGEEAAREWIKDNTAATATDART